MELLTFILVLAAAGGVAGITAGLFGVGGGFVVVPALLVVFPMFGEFGPELMYVAVGTSLASIVVSSARAVQAHMARDAVDFQVLRDWTPWLVLGVIVGLLIAAVSSATALIMVFASGVLAYSIYFLFPKRFEALTGRYQMPTGIGRAALASILGGFSALLGIGGGTVTVMTMVICNRSVHQAVATAAGVGFVIGLPGAIGFLVLGWGTDNLPPGSLGYVNVPALAAIAAVSIVTAPVGARWAHSLNDVHLKRLFGLYLIVVALGMYAKALQGT